MDRNVFLLLSLLLFCCISMANLAMAAAPTNIASDQPALLALKAHITNDPQNILSSWSTTTSVCSWVGVTCIGRHFRVSVLNLSSMGLTGTIPPHLGNLSYLIELNFTNNSFHGILPRELSRLRRLKVISFGYNNFMGSIPPWFGSFPKLESFNLYGNQFSGSIPTSIFNLSSLQVMNLNKNQLSGSIPREIRNLTMLKKIYLDFNNFEEIPNEIGSIQLQMLSVIFNALKGPVPMVVFNMSSLITLALSGNSLNGGIPYNICEQLPSIKLLLLGHNHFDGPLPSELGQCKQLLILSLSYNNFRGSIPKNIGNLTQLKTIYLGFNNLTGNIPDEIGNLKVMTAIDLSSNHFSGIIPSSIGGLQDLFILSLENNNLEGSIPSSFGNLLSLEHLDLSENNLSGVIPKSLETLVDLVYLNLSFNGLQGEIPTGGPFQNFSAQSFVSNGALCGELRFQVPPCRNSTLKPYSREASTSILKYVIPGILGVMLLWTFIWLFLPRENGNVEVATDTTNLPQLQWRNVSYQELQSVTNGFNESNLLGTGAFGSVYKGTLSDGIEVAVKVFNPQLEGAFKTLDTEGEMLSNIHHRNLIKIISSCSEIDFKALVMNYMSNGSLERWLYSENCSLNIIERLNIMIDVASALECLHHGYSTPVVHCDLKPSNILLDDDMVAHVSDFGIAKLLGGGDSITQTMTLATVGYMAPEYGMEGIVSTRGDVYSFGIVLMETFTKRKPTDEIFSGEVNLKQSIASSLSTDAIVEVVEANLLGTEEEDDFVRKRDCLSSVLRLALACSTESPQERINMQDAVVTLNRIKMKF